MLGKLLKLLEEHPDQLTQEQICVQLGVTPQGLQSMLEILVRKGRLTAIPPQVDGGCSNPCQDCPIAQSCTLDNTETFYQMKSVSQF
jgi:hypothetical protein